jgi:transposase-like protein
VAETDLFKWRHYESEIILLCVRWYLRYALSYRDLEEMMRERGLSLNHTTIYRWVQAYAPELEKRIRPHLRPTSDSCRVDETYVKIKGEWKYLYRAVDSTGQTIDFMLSAKRDAKAAKRFFRKMLKAVSHSSPRVINIDKNPIYPPAIEQLKEEGVLPNRTQLRQCKYLNNLIEMERLSPILMTALATGVGLVPLALGVGEPGREIQQPMAVVSLGGIFTSTFLNMIVIPALYLKYGRAAAPTVASDFPRGAETAPSVTEM